jgi:phasin family protein
MVDAKSGKSVAKPAKVTPRATPIAKPAAEKTSADAATAPHPKKAANTAPAPVAAVPPAPVPPAKAVEVSAKTAEPPVEAAKVATVEPAGTAAAKAADATARTTEKLLDKVTTETAAVPKAATPNIAAKPIQKGLFAMPETISATFPTTPESFQAMFGDVSTRAKAAMENSTKMAEELGEFAKGNVEALMTSSRLAAKGAETLGAEAAAYSKKSLETATSAFKGFAAAKSPTELFKLQSDYARSSFDAAVAESSKFSEAMMKLFGEITQPISSRVALAAEKIKSPAF